MTKKLMRGLVPVMVLSAAVALFTGCGSKDSGADSKPAGDSKETTAEAGKDTLDHHIPFGSFSYKCLMALPPSIFSHIQYQKDIMQKKTGTPIKEFRPYKA